MKLNLSVKSRTETSVWVLIPTLEELTTRKPFRASWKCHCKSWTYAKSKVPTTRGSESYKEFTGFMSQIFLCYVCSRKFLPFSESQLPPNPLITIQPDTIPSVVLSLRVKVPQTAGGQGGCDQCFLDIIPLTCSPAWSTPNLIHQVTPWRHFKCWTESPSPSMSSSTCHHLASPISHQEGGNLVAPHT